MLEKFPESSGNVLGCQIIGEVTKMDYEYLIGEVQRLVDQHGSINLLLDLEGFKSEPPAVWREDLKFGQTYRKAITKLAIVGDKGWEHLLASVAAPFYAKESRYFDTAERAAAWAWLRFA